MMTASDRPGHGDARPALWARIASMPLIGLIWLYRVTLSHLIGGHCRFFPTCSEYALQAIRAHGPIRGTRLAAWRVLRCHPFSRGGHDPVPPKGRG